MFPSQIIIEGPDRTGKDTQINLLQQYAWNNHKLAYNLSHYSHLKNINNYQSYSNALYDNLIYRMCIGNTYDIYNRSHIGEYVYAPMYRNYSGDYIFDIEMKYFIDNYDHIFLITLITDPLVLISRDDKLSFSNNLEQKQLEISKFKEAHELSIIKKKLLIDCTDMSKEEVQELIIQNI